MKDERIYLDAQLNAVEAYPAAGGRVAIVSRRCPGKTTPNEDSAALFVLDERSAVLVVADGLGGGPAGEQASGLAVAALRDALQNATPGEPVRTAILDAIEAANRKIQAAAPQAATTLAVVEVQNDKMRTYHVGDSAIWVVSQRGRLKLQTVAHSPVGYAVEAGVLDAAEAMHHEARHVVSNVVGTPNMRVEMGAFLKLRPRDTVLLASDGLFDNLHEVEIVARIRTGDLVAGVERLTRDASARMLEPAAPMPSKPDDLTIVAFRPTAP